MAGPKHVKSLIGMVEGMMLDNRPPQWEFSNCNGYGIMLAALSTKTSYE
jgi:hypothetical protein